MEELKELASELEKSEKKVDENREIWIEKTLPLLKNTLENIKEKILNQAYIEVNDRIKNLETIYLSFGTLPSSLVKQDEKIIPLKKQGGSIFYSLDYCGKVYVWYSAPNIEGVIEAIEKFNKIRYVELNEITDTTIKEDVKVFLKAIIKWNNGVANTNWQPIGFNTTENNFSQ